MNTNRIISIAVLVIAVFALAFVSAQEATTLEKVVLFLLPLMGLMLGLLIGEETRDFKDEK